MVVTSKRPSFDDLVQRANRIGDNVLFQQSTDELPRVIGVNGPGLTKRAVADFAQSRTNNYGGAVITGAVPYAVSATVKGKKTDVLVFPQLNWRAKRLMHGARVLQLDHPLKNDHDLAKELLLRTAALRQIPIGSERYVRGRLGAGAEAHMAGKEAPFPSTYVGVVTQFGKPVGFKMPHQYRTNDLAGVLMLTPNHQVQTGLVSTTKHIGRYQWRELLANNISNNEVAQSLGVTAPLHLMGDCPVDTTYKDLAFLKVTGDNSVRVVIPALDPNTREDLESKTESELVFDLRSQQMRFVGVNMQTVECLAKKHPDALGAHIELCYVTTAQELANALGYEGTQTGIELADAALLNACDGILQTGSYQGASLVQTYASPFEKSRNDFTQDSFATRVGLNLRDAITNATLGTNNGRFGDSKTGVLVRDNTLCAAYDLHALEQGRVVPIDLADLGLYQ